MGYDKSDAAKDTGSTIGEVSGAWHNARDDATSSGHFERGSGNTGGWDTPSRAHTEARETLTDVVADGYARESSGGGSDK